MSQDRPIPLTRTEWIDTLRGEMVILIIVFHATGLLRFGRGRAPKAVEWFNQLSDPHWMPTLSFLSGFLSDSSIDKPRHQFYVGKARTTLYPYAVWTAIHAMVFRTPLTSKGLLRISTGGTYLFFLPFLFVSNVLGYELRRLPPASIAAAALAANATLPARFSSAPPRFTRVLPHIIAMFFWGRLAARNETTWRRCSPPLLAAASIAGASSGVTAILRKDSVSYEAAWAWSPAMALLPLSIAAQRRAPTATTDALQFVGRNSLVYYTSHYPAAYSTIRALDKRGVTGVRVFAVTLFTSFGVSTALAIAQRSRFVRRLFAL